MKRPLIDRSNHRRGENHPRAKVADELVMQVREMRNWQGLGYKRIAQLTGLSRSTIRGWCKGRTRTGGP